MSTPTRETLAARLRELADDLAGDFGANLPVLRQAADALAAMAWQPIDTAPNDRPLLLWCADEETAPWAYRTGYWDHDDGVPYWCYLESSAAYCRAHQPTHWMPLPDPPATAHPGADTGTEREG